MRTLIRAGARAWQRAKYPAMARQSKNIVPAPVVRLNSQDVPKWACAVPLPPGDVDVVVLLNDLREYMSLVDEDNDYGCFLRSLAAAARLHRTDRTVARR